MDIFPHPRPHAADSANLSVVAVVAVDAARFRRVGTSTDGDGVRVGDAPGYLGRS